jgi:chlorite dismutase
LEASDNEQYFFNFSFFKLDSKWRWMADLAKEESAKEVENVIINSGIKFRSYSTYGMTQTFCFGLQPNQ